LQVHPCRRARRPSSCAGSGCFQQHERGKVRAATFGICGRFLQPAGDCGDPCRRERPHRRGVRRMVWHRTTRAFDKNSTSRRATGSNQLYHLPAEFRRIGWVLSCHCGLPKFKRSGVHESGATSRSDLGEVRSHLRSRSIYPWGPRLRRVRSLRSLLRRAIARAAFRARGAEPISNRGRQAATEGNRKAVALSARRLRRLSRMEALRAETACGFGSRQPDRALTRGDAKNPITSHPPVFRIHVPR
jgi:hypothetical protein